jgi:transcriptional regulator GlxA family with amidase domain
MYLESLERVQNSAPVPLHTRRSLSGGFVFLSQNPEMSFATQACIDVLRTANRLIGQRSYTWAEHEIGNAPGLSCGPDQTLVLIGGIETPWRPHESHLRDLRALIRNAARVCVVGSAVFVPLAAGVLGARRLSVHPNFRVGVQESGRALELSPDTTCHHKALSSAISPTAATRMMVELVGMRDGEFTRATLAKYLGLSTPDEETSGGEHWRYTRLAQGDMVISDALKIMLEHLEDTLSVGQIADILEVSPRKLERGFSDLLHQTPLKVYRDLRLDRARSLLAQTSLPMNEVSVACGFSNVTLMKKWFMQKYGELPCQVRQHAFGSRL